jgi:hypothetical protein
MIIHGYYSEGKELYTEGDLLNSINGSLDARTIKNYFIAIGIDSGKTGKHIITFGGGYVTNYS